MSSYVNAILTGSEYFMVNLEQHIDDYIIRRMIKCCSNLGCYMAAYVLCQVTFVLVACIVSSGTATQTRPLRLHVNSFGKKFENDEI